VIKNAFPGGWGKIPDTPLVAASVAALLKGGRGARALVGGWSSDRQDRLTYPHIDEGGGRIVVSLDPDVVLASEGDASLTSQWSFVEGISALTIDVLLAVLAQTCAAGADSASNCARPTPIAVTARAILRYKGLQRWGAEGAALRRRVDREIIRLQGLRFNVHRSSAPGSSPGRWNADGASVDGDRLFDIVDSAIVGSTRKGSPAQSETVWLMRAGQWSQWWINSETEVRFGAVPREVLEFDHRRNRGSAVLAKKIGLNTMVPWAGLRSPRALDRRIGDLLADIGELPRRDLRHSRWGARMRGRFDEAILMLRETGVLGIVEWPARYGPESAGRGRGWVETWLASKIVLNRHGVLDDCYAKAARHLRKTRGTGGTASGQLELRRGSVIRTIRIARDVSQCRLAGELGISASYLSQIENERRMASQAVLERIAGWVRANGEADRDGQRMPGAVFAIETVSRWQQSSAGKEQQVAGSQFVQAPVTGTPIGKDDRT
jgi:transcriptional regulator with XRE-family HTH domain